MFRLPKGCEQLRCDPCPTFNLWRYEPNRIAAFTLLELLIVIAILSALLGILLPALSASRERGKISVCLFNCKQQGAALTAYQQQSEPFQLPWYVAWNLGNETFRSGNMGYGGVCQMLAPSSPPTDARPLNRFLGVESARGIDSVFHCPSEGWAGEWNPSGRGGTTEPIYQSAWQEWGNCYVLNIHWVVPARERHESMYDVIDHVGPSVLRKKIGGEASKFIIVLEDPGDISFWRSTTQLETSGAVPVRGWHGKIGVYTALFLDGHATHEWIDTRLSVGSTWSVW